MHGIHASFPVALFAGARVIGLRPLTGIFYFDFSRDRTLGDPTWPSEFSMGIESTWHVRSPRGEDSHTAEASEGTAVDAAATLTGKLIREAVVLSPTALVLRFESGEELEVWDDSEEYESFCIPELVIYI
jgi:hypothetical protein